MNSFIRENTDSGTSLFGIILEREIMEGENRQSIFTRRSGGGRSLSIFDRPSTSRREQNRYVLGNGRFNIPEIAHQVKTHGSAEFEFGEDELGGTIRPPRAFQRQFGRAHQDAFDIHDTNLPANEMVDVPSPEFHRCVRQVIAYPVETSTLEPVTKDGCVRKRILKEGTGSYRQVVEGCRVWIHYDTYLDNLDGRRLMLLDSTTHHEMAASLEIGNEGLVGLQLGLETMRKGEIAELSMSPTYAYGAQGIPGFIGKNQNLRIIVELKDVKRTHRKPMTFMTDAEKKAAEITLDDVLTEAEQLLKAGNAKFEKRLYGDACDRYNWALDLFNDHQQKITRGNQGKFKDEDAQLLVDHKKFQIYSNLALALIRKEDYEEAEKACQAAFQIRHQPSDLIPKVFHRQALAMIKQGKFFEAKCSCVIALRSTCWGHAEFRDLKFRAESALMRSKAEKMDTQQEKQQRSHY